MPYEIGLDLRFSQLHTCFSLYFSLCLVCSSLTVTAFQLSLWTLSSFPLFLQCLQLLLVTISSLILICLMFPDLIKLF